MSPRSNRPRPALIRIAQHLDEHIETYLASAALAIFTSLVIVQVVMRYVFGSPLTWSEELARYALVWFVWIAGSYAVRYERHVKFSVLVEAIGRRSPIARRVIRVAVLLLWFMFLGTMLWLSIQMIRQQLASGQIASASRLPMYLVYLGLPIGMFLMSFRVIQHTVRAVRELVTRSAPPKPATGTGVA